MHRRTWAIVARFIEAKARDCLQVPVASAMTRWFYSILVQESRASDLHQCLSGPGGPGPGDEWLLGVSFLHLYVHCQRLMAPGAWLTDIPRPKTATEKELQAFVKLLLCCLGFGRSILLFRLANLLPNPLLACAGPSSYPIPFLDLLGVLCSYPI